MRKFEGISLRMPGPLYAESGLASNSQTPLSARGGLSPLAQLAMAFTPKQRAELEHQVLLTKYLVANIRIPSELLRPLGNHGLPSERFATKSPFHNPLTSEYFTHWFAWCLEAFVGLFLSPHWSLE